MSRLTALQRGMITEFQGKYRFLSNFWPCQIVMRGQVFPSVENAYQAAKTLDLEARQAFTCCASGAAKKLGRRLELRPDWDEVKEDLMLRMLRMKFRGELAELLLGTADAHLQEGNRWGDRYWGVDLQTGVGENRLGSLLMTVRAELRQRTGQSRG
ncbi:N-glycosidase YbiA [Deinococcus xinjiangensis]|uniref:N-glycosidase YbiA n=1 Tax=Deinococcus xinjiangensis TaxID=457454 RepID=A0ABP9VA58_9DEIO